MPRLSFQAKLGAAVLVPLVAAVLLGINGIVERYDVGEHMADVQRLTLFSIKVSALVHEMQRERGRSAGFLGFEGSKFREELATQRAATDATLAGLREFMADFKTNGHHLDDRCRELWQSASTQLDRMPSVRQAVSDHAVAVDQVVDYYTDSIATLLNTVTTALELSERGAVSSAASAYASFLHLKEQTGLERAVLTNTFARDTFDDGILSRFLLLVGAQAAYEREFLSMATPDEAAFYRQTVSGPEVDAVARLRQMALNLVAESGFGVDADQWFKLITVKIDRQKRVEDRLAADLQADADRAITKAKEVRNLYTALTLGVIIVSAGLAISLSRSITKPIRILIRTAEQVTADGNYAVRVPEITHDELGILTDCFNEMLAKIESNAVEMLGRKATLEQEVFVRTAELREAQRALIHTARHAGMAEIANGLLHNLGNTLNSVNIAAECAARKVHDTQASQLAKVVDLLRENRDNLATFLTQDKGRHLLTYLEKLSVILAEERQVLLTELGDLTRGIDHIKEIVSTQQAYAGISSVMEPVKPVEVINDALRMSAASLSSHNVQLVQDLADLPAVSLDRYKVLQILLNLILNAKQALESSDASEKRIHLRMESLDTGSLRITVADNGIGMSPEVLRKLFSHGFTTKKNGHGFGLHSSALAARSMGGSLTAHSAGPGCGATFVFDLPSSIRDETVSH